jgi:hypothetical protein
MHDEIVVSILGVYRHDNPNLRRRQPRVNLANRSCEITHGATFRDFHRHY